MLVDHHRLPLPGLVTLPANNGKLFRKTWGWLTFGVIGSPNAGR
jgi:hypothetical protein